MSRSLHLTSRFWMVVCVLTLYGMVAGHAAAPAAAYLGPSDLVASQDGKTLFVLNADASQIAVVDAAGGKVSRTIPMPAPPTGLALSPDGATLYVTCAKPEGLVAVVDVGSGRVAATIPAGHTASGPAVTPDGKRLYVCNRFDNDVSVIDLESKKELARLPVVREPIASAVTPDGTLVFVTNHLPIDPADGNDVAGMVSVIDTATNEVSGIRLPNGSTSLRGICVSPDGKYAYLVHVLARYQMPTTQLERGWMNTNAMSIIDVEGKKLLNTVLLDDIDLGAANPRDVACTPDGSTICVTHAGTHEISVIDAAGLLDKLSKIPPDEQAALEEGNRYDNRGTFSSATAADVPNDLAFLVGLRRRIKLEGNPPGLARVEGKAKGPRGLVMVGPKAYIAVYFSDTVGVIDVSSETYRSASTIRLGPEPQLTVQRRGEIYFHDAGLCFQNWQSCSSCHPDARMDALNWDLMNDGMGNPKNVRSMLLAHRTPPAMSSGVRPDAEYAVRSGIERIQFAVRPEEDAVAIDEYLKALKPVPSPHLVNGQLSEAANRGRSLFFSERVGCSKCHPEPLYSDLQMHDVASRGQYDRRDDFDTPTLIEVWRTAPYMHDGHYTTMKEVFTKGKHGKKGGEIEKLSDQEIDDLVEFVMSL